MADRNEQDLLMIVSGLLVLIFVGIVADRSPLKKRHAVVSTSTEQISRETLSRIHFDRQAIKQKVELERLRVQLENTNTKAQFQGAELASTQGERDDALTGPHTQPVDLVPEDKVTNTYQALKVADPDYDVDNLPTERINQLLEQRKFANDYDSRLNQAYVNEFVDNARRDGLMVQLNDRGEVVKVQQIH